jgi:hypothetical protein
VFIEPLLSNNRSDTYRHTDWWERFKEYAVEIGPGAMIHIPLFIKIGSGVQKLVGIYTETHRQQVNLISLLLVFFFKIKKVG